MIWIQGDTRPRHLGFPMHYGVVLPDAACHGQDFPAVLCLHDMGEDGSAFLKKARMEALVERYGLALILPDGRFSCFMDMAHGPAWGRALAQGLLPTIQTTFAVRTGRYGVLGVGTGAFGAVHLAASDQQCMAACAAIDLPMDLLNRYAQGELTPAGEWPAVFGSVGEENRQQTCLQKVLSGDGVPPLCLIDSNGQAPELVRSLAQSRLDIQARALPEQAGFEEKLDAALSYLAVHLQ